MLVSPYFSNVAFGALTPLAVVYSLASHLWCRVRGTPPVTPLPSPSAALRHNVVIVTGSNTGIGYETARTLAVDYGMTVVLACRSRDKGERAVAQIRRRGGAGAIFVQPLDLSSSQSIADFATAIKNKFEKIHVLVNNAGRNTSGEAAEGTRDLLFQTNFVGHFELTALLMETFAPKARIVNLSSVMHHFTVGNVNDVSYWKGCMTHGAAPTSTYQPSKLAAVLFTMELNRRYSDRIESVVVNPGGVNSDIWRDFPRFVVPLFALAYLTIQQGCRTSVAGAVCAFNELQLTPNVPYLQPYYTFSSSSSSSSSSMDKPLFPLFEMLGVFAGHLKAKPRLPDQDGGIQAAKALWQASLETTKTVWPETATKP